ncbi:uncharacterized protein LOC112571809 isoform X2 [Pomacea canaliculata]|uniref:uncharacterized protein LOC112571809 isoform X2 n=1 Tax=Pomacea canaliculata TaxID=400727 RepID=UPI000D736C91|nr:uncharacterized protein LOC112571809 isoform X2 [Pomacea canaliculata]
MSQQGTMMITVFCLLPLFSHLQPATGELLESIGSQTHKENYNEIVCTFNLKVSLSRVDFVDKTGSEVFAIVDCGTSCNVFSSYQDVLRIVSPQKTISGDRFVFNATHSDRTTGTYTCHGIPATEVVYPPLSGDGDDDGGGDGDGEESQMTSAPPPETDEASHNAGGSSNGLLALIIIPILLVLIGVVLFLHWWGVIQIPGLPKTRGEPRDLRRIVGKRLQPVTGWWERTRGLWQSTRAYNQDPLERLESNCDPDEEVSLKDTELIAQNEDNLSLRLDAAPEKFKSDLPYPVKESLDYEGNDNEVSVVEERQPLLRGSFHNTKPTQGANASIEEYQTSPQPTLSPNSTDTNNENSDVEDRQTLQSLHLSSSTKATDVAADLSAASLSRDSIQHKEESAHTNSHSSAPHDTGALKPEPTKSPVPPKRKKQPLKDSSPLIDHKESMNDRPSQISTESENDDVSKKKSSRDPGASLQHTPQTSGTRIETERRKNEIMSGQLKTSRNTEGIEGTEKREDEKVRVDMKEEESSEAKSETINNDDVKEQLTTNKKGRRW